MRSRSATRARDTGASFAPISLPQRWDHTRQNGPWTGLWRSFGEPSGAASAAQLKVVPRESCLQKGKEPSRARVSSSCSLFCCRCCCCVVFFFVTSCVSYGHQRRSLASKGELRELGSFSKAKCAGEAAASSAMLLPIHLTPVVGSLCVRPCPGVTWDPWVCR